MAKRDTGGPAFPRPASVDPTQGTLPDGDRVIDPQGGMTLRDYFAASAMAAIVTNDAFYCRLIDIVERGDCPYDRTQDAMAHAAFQMADAMIAARSEKPEPPTGGAYAAFVDDTPGGD